MKFGVLLIVVLIRFAIAQFEGDKCVRMYDGSAGICKESNDCPQVQKEYVELQVPITHCAYIKRKYLVCCPSIQTPVRHPTHNVLQHYRPVLRSSFHSDLKISAKKCQEYSELTRTTFYVNSRPHFISNCIANPKSLIVGGTKTKPGEFPHMAALGWTEGNEIRFKCGGSLISERYVLTAAHCCSNRGIPPDVVRLGEHNLKRSGLDVSSNAIDHKVIEVIKHPNYKSKSTYYDIALLKLIQTVVFNQFVRPACLWQTDNINDTKAIAIGFGSTGYAEEQSDDLLKVDLDIIDNQECRNYIEEMKRLDKGIISSQICAGILDGGKDTCGGDSGGPLQITEPKNPCVYYLIGLTSFGSTYCGGKNSPGVYSRVSSYLDWIEPIVW